MTNEPILVVDDNPTNLKLLRVLLTGQGFSVRTAADAMEAMKCIEMFPPVLILMDLQLPGISGLDLTRRLKADPLTAGITIVALTAFAMKGDEESARAAGCDGYITKPIDTRTLPARVRQYLQDSRPASTVPEHPGLFGEMTDLRDRFLSEGSRQSQTLLDSLDSGFELEGARKIVHDWIGMGGSFGVAGVTEIGRELSALLAVESGRDTAAIRAALGKIRAAFSPTRPTP